MTPAEVRNLADALDQLAETRTNFGVVPGQSYEGPHIHLAGADESWELDWVEGDDDNPGHYTAAPERHR